MLGVVFADGEITSNLRLTQAVYDFLVAQGHNLDGINPLPESDVFQAMNSVLPTLLKEDGVTIQLCLIGTDWSDTASEAQALLTNEVSLKQVLVEASRESNAYADQFIFKPKGK